MPLYSNALNQGISVAICTYNGQNYINEQLLSISKQSILPDEVIICDDASTDQTVQTINRFIDSSNLNIKLFTNPFNIGYTSNFERCLNYCSYDYIFLSDQDDVWDSNKIEAIIPFFQTNKNILGVTHDGRLVDEKLKWSGMTKNCQIRDGYGPNIKCITGALSCIRKDALKFILPIPVNIRGHDIWMNYIFEYLPNLWIFSDSILQDLRRHPDNTSQWVVNSFSKIGFFDVFKDQIQTQPSVDYQDRLTMNHQFKIRLSNITLNELDPFSPDFSDIIRKVNLEHNAIILRQSLVNDNSKPSRILKAFKLYLSGGYSFFNGYKSLARDLFR